MKYKLPKILGVLFISAFAIVSVVKAEYYYSGGASTNTATSSPTFLARNTTIATTTTPVFDSYYQYGTNQGSGNNTAVYNAYLLIQYTASSTTSVLNWAYEYADDQGTGNLNCVASSTSCDWYSDSIFYTAASTTPSNNVTPTNSYTWTFASSTIGGIGQSATNQLSTKIVVVPVPTRYVRVVFWCSSAQNCAVWSKFVPIKLN